MILERVGSSFFLTHFTKRLCDTCTQSHVTPRRVVNPWLACHHQAPGSSALPAIFSEPPVVFSQTCSYENSVEDSRDLLQILSTPLGSFLLSRAVY